MNKFDIMISINVSRPENYGQIIFAENIKAKEVPAKIIYTLLTWVFKLTEGYTND